MPPIIVGNTAYKKSTFEPARAFDYTYPDDLDLKPGSALHDKVRDKVMERAHDSARVMTTRHGDWNKIDHTL